MNRHALNISLNYYKDSASIDILLLMVKFPWGKNLIMEQITGVLSHSSSPGNGQGSSGQHQLIEVHVHVPLDDSGTYTIR